MQTPTVGKILTYASFKAARELCGQVDLCAHVGFGVHEFSDGSLGSLPLFDPDGQDVPPPASFTAPVNLSAAARD